MSVYQKYPSLEASSVKQRAKYARRSALELLKSGIEPERFLALAGDCVDDECYEMAQGIGEALKEFRANPQLGLF